MFGDAPGILVVGEIVHIRPTTRGPTGRCLPSWVRTRGINLWCVFRRADAFFDAGMVPHGFHDGRSPLKRRNQEGGQEESQVIGVGGPSRAESDWRLRAWGS